MLPFCKCLQVEVCFRSTLLAQSFKRLFFVRRKFKLHTFAWIKVCFNILENGNFRLSNALASYTFIFMHKLLFKRQLCWHYFHNPYHSVILTLTGFRTNYQWLAHFSFFLDGFERLYRFWYFHITFLRLTVLTVQVLLCALKHTLRPQFSSFLRALNYHFSIMHRQDVDFLLILLLFFIYINCCFASFFACTSFCLELVYSYLASRKS